MFDSTLAGGELEHEHHLKVDVAPGTYLIRTAYVEPRREQHWCWFNWPSIR
ncbi:hypothetical protein M2302_006156 [Micromonospora sp. A200]|uniref:hypothetical protein n=1 Tax=Micromonospora sp. A200 TaxID=2940568 RepID=UPI00247713CD|nr:hypothetical protein [Micromonospora sp. A200]MDH6465954.1 hypothetical protein [Micromonospora sp. A200]